MGYVSLFITIPLTIFAVLFAMANIHTVTIYFMLLDKEGLEIPAYFLGLAMLGGGFFFGALFVWLHSQKTRLLYWKETRKTKQLIKDIGDLQKKQKKQIVI